jgi:hypothetical protein
VRRPVVCDHCGTLIAGPHAADVAWRFDGDGRLVEIVLVHGAGRGCTYGERITVGRYVEVPAVAFGQHAETIRTLARAHEGASVSRMARKLRSLEGAAAATDGQIGPHRGNAA